jgi:hypothetical protein
MYKMDNMDNKKVAKVETIYVCECCNYKEKHKKYLIIILYTI